MFHFPARHFFALFLLLTFLRFNSCESIVIFNFIYTIIVKQIFYLYTITLKKGRNNNFFNLLILRVRMKINKLLQLIVI